MQMTEKTDLHLSILLKKTKQRSMRGILMNNQRDWLGSVNIIMTLMENLILILAMETATVSMTRRTLQEESVLPQPDKRYLYGQSIILT